MIDISNTISIGSRDNGINWSSSCLKLTFDDIANVPVADASSVSDWNTWFDLPANGTPFITARIDGNAVFLGGTGGNIKLKDNLFGDDACGIHLLSIIDNGIGVIELGDGVFGMWNIGGGGCPNLINAEFPYLTSIGEGAFCYAMALTGFIIAPTVINIKDSAFQGCYSLTNIIVPEGITSIGVAVFADCEILTSVTLPNSLISIGDSAFNYCIALPNIFLPENLTSIGKTAFGNNEALTSINIPSAITTIGSMAFRDNSLLLTVNMYPTTAPTVDATNTFSNNAATLHIPAGATGYDVAPWTNTNKFASIVQDL